MSSSPPLPSPTASSSGAKSTDPTGEALLQQLRAALESERQKHGDELGIRTLEAFAARYRNAIDKTRKEIDAAAQTAASLEGLPAVVRSHVFPFSSQHVDSLIRAHSAMRQDLDDLQFEIGERREAIARGREEKILRTTARAAVVQATAAVVLLVVTGVLTGWYAWRTDQLVRAQVEPSVELVVPTSSTSVIVSNDGAFSIADVRLDAEQAIETPDGRAVSWLIPGPRIPGEPPMNWWHADKLGPGEQLTRSLSEKAEEALGSLAMLQTVQAKGGLTNVSKGVELHAELLIRLTYRRAVDGKQYSKTKQMRVGRVSNTGKPTLWPDNLLRRDAPR